MPESPKRSVKGISFTTLLTLRSSQSSFSGARPNNLLPALRLLLLLLSLLVSLSGEFDLLDRRPLLVFLLPFVKYCCQSLSDDGPSNIPFDLCDGGGGLTIPVLTASTELFGREKVPDDNRRNPDSTSVKSRLSSMITWRSCVLPALRLLPLKLFLSVLDARRPLFVSLSSECDALELRRIVVLPPLSSEFDTLEFRLPLGKYC
mmetsp:Transcript_1094/g.1826  ORF Transcript_1094/g.1826 Transcript_1094/m.1826 type:complete len:204 (+) Transcript_1094:916-1527(+)